jgi:hypothetical protein
LNLNFSFTAPSATSTHASTTKNNRTARQSTPPGTCISLFFSGLPSEATNGKRAQDTVVLARLCQTQCSRMIKT